MAWMIRRCAELHMRQIAQGGDPFETGSARPLDFGHWAAHKLEGLTRHHLRHGEAVAIGIALDARYSVLAGLLAPGEELRIAALLEHLGFRLYHPALAQRQGGDGPLAVLAGLREFREHLGGELTVTLIDAIGSGVEVNRMDHALIEQAIGWLAERRG
jgi:3-dehydroquinate synthase